MGRRASNARNAWSSRRALVVELDDGEGCRGQGEAAPLEGYSPDSFEEVETVLRRLLGSELAAVPEEGLPPSARFALETAWLDLAARRSGCSLPELLGVPSSLRVSICASVEPGALERQVASVAEAWKRGFRCFKVKIGAAGEWRRELELISELRRGFGGELRLRADANGAFDAASLPAVLDALEPLGVELLEEPVTGAAWAGVKESRLTLGADESLQRLSPEVLEAFDRGVLRVAVLKPTTLGGPSRCLALADRLSRAGAGYVVGHAFEGPLGLAACAAVALALAARRAPALAAGLDRHPGLSAWPEIPLPFEPGCQLGPWSVPGLGIDVRPP